MDNLSTKPIEKLRDRMGEASQDDLPKYMQLRAKFLELIENGDWAVGDKLPTEADLAKELPVSLGTIQKAYNVLAKEGYIGRRRGLGSFVQQRQQMAGPLHCRFAGDDGDVLPIFPVVRSLYRFNAKAPLAAAFGGTDDLMRIEREISVNHEFTVWNRFYIPFENAQPLLDLPKEELGFANFKTILGAEPRSLVARIDQRTFPGVPELHTAAEPEIVKSTVFTVECKAVDRDGATVYLLELLIPKTDRALLTSVIT